MKSAGKLSANTSAILERVMPLRVRHRARVEPAVDDFRDAAVLAALVHERHAVDGRPVQVELAELAARALLELGDGADADVVAVAVRPERQRRAPEALTRQRPVDVVLEPVAEASFANVLRHPLDAAIELDHALPILASCGCTRRSSRSRSAGRRCASRTDSCADTSARGTAGRARAGSR